MYYKAYQISGKMPLWNNWYDYTVYVDYFNQISSAEDFCNTKSTPAPGTTNIIIPTCQSHRTGIRHLEDSTLIEATRVEVVLP